MNRSYGTSSLMKIMAEFATLTGLSPAGAIPKRYLWTDAFAVCNFLELFRRTGDPQYKALALLLVEQVHEILGRHRGDDARTGRISGLDENEGRLHPTKGGLRIGKQWNERGPSDPFDERLEWDRDGQYYHYLTKWMHALNRVSDVTGDPTFNRWAVELAKTAHAAFVYLPSSGPPNRIYWKMSIDLSHPLVPSMGQHDPIDGFITYHQLQARADDDTGPSTGPDLHVEIAEMARVCAGRSWVTSDPLGIGGVLADAFKAAQLTVRGKFDRSGLLETLLKAALQGLGFFARDHSLEFPPEYRLGFRELGLSIGLRAVERLHELMERNPNSSGRQSGPESLIEDLMAYVPLSEEIETCWLEPANREAANWKEHREINMVMLGTSLAPDGYLKI